MVWFVRRHDWHQQVEIAAAGVSPIETDQLIPNPNFPWLQLQMRTDLYLNKKGQPASLERDARLVALVEKHAAKDVAMAASAHAMSPQIVREILITHLSVQPGTIYGLTTLLRTIIVAHHVKPSAVSEVEARWARLLAPFSDPGSADVVIDLQQVVESFLMGVPTDLILYPHVLVFVRRACTQFAGRLKILKANGRWSQAYIITAWLSTLIDSGRSHEQLVLEQLLDGSFPNWRIWAGWRPNRNRLSLWEAFGDERRVSLRDLLALEGPDFEGHGKMTFCEGLCAQVARPPQSTIRRGDLHLQLKTGSASEAQAVLNRLLFSLDASCKAGPDDLRLLRYLFVGKLIENRAFEILEGVRTMEDASVSSWVLEIFTACDEHGKAPVVGMMRLLPALNTERGVILREALMGYLVEAIPNCIGEIQRTLKRHLLAGGPWDATAIKLQILGKHLREASWLRPQLGASLQLLTDNWPSLADIKELYRLKLDAQSMGYKSTDPLMKKIHGYCLDCLVTPNIIDAPTRRLIGILIGIWQQPPENDHRAIALAAVHHLDSHQALCNQCLEQLPALTNGFAHSLRVILECFTQDSKNSCIQLARLLASTPFTDATTCWRPVLHRMMEKQKSKLIDWSFMELPVDTWLQWLADLGYVFAGLMRSPQLFRPAFLRPNLYQWGQRLAVYLPTLQRLESVTNSEPALKCIMMGCEEPLSNVIVQCLDLLESYKKEYQQPAMQSIIIMLTLDGHNLREISEALSRLSVATPDGVDTCVRVMELYKQGTASGVAGAILAGWLQASDLFKEDLAALKAVSVALGVQLDAQGSPAAANIEEAADYLDNEVAVLLAEAQRLENLRLSCRALDPDGVSRLLAELRIEAPSALEDAVASLPAALVDVVEKVGEHEVELNLPLTHLTPVQRIALGAGSSPSLLVRLILGDGGLPPGFCLHLDDETHDSAQNMPGSFPTTTINTSHSHSPCIVFDGDSEPEWPFCHGRTNRMTYQLARILSRHLRNGLQPLEKIHDLLTNSLKQLAQGCMVCGTPIEARLVRSTLCQSPACRTILNRAHPDLHLADIREDPTVVDLLLTALYAVAISGQSSKLLLPGCTAKITDEGLQLLDILPPLSQLQNVTDLSSALKGKGGIASERLLAWVCSNYNGFLVSASPKLRIPSMPGVHQFVLVNAAPAVEIAFRSRMGSQSTRALFHGTSLDRLHAILGQGLQVLSGTGLQRHGASLGNGIYLAEEPATSWGYSAVSKSWRHSAFHNVRVVLGCEVVDPTQYLSRVPGTYVVTDPSMVMVRYIFLVSATATAPLARHVTPAMESSFASLRSGAV
ncbi:hypothetical protein MMC30_004855 [Trapelia coarctata]|nr:hypothetical protein [Trapelia coarctata]